MTWYMNEERELIQNVAREFAQEECAQRAKEIDISDEFPWDLVERCKELNFLGIPIPEEYGGLGADIITNCLVLEEISKECDMLAAVIDINVSAGAMPILHHGTEEQKQKYLVPSATGDKLIAFGLTEPEAGSDAGNTQTTAVLEGDEWVINGSKCFITLVGIAKTYLITAKTDVGISAFIVEDGAPGFELGQLENKCGMHGSCTGDLYFRNCRIPKENLLGEEGKGLSIFLGGLDEARIAVAAICLGLSEGALEKSIAYTKERVAFNRPICQFQGLQWMMAEMKMEIEAARNLVYAAAYKRDCGEPYTMEASIAKAYATEVAVRVTNKAIELHGGIGYMTELGIERMMRNARIWTIGEGTSQIQRNIIAKLLLK